MAENFLMAIGPGAKRMGWGGGDGVGECNTLVAPGMENVLNLS